MQFLVSDACKDSDEKHLYKWSQHADRRHAVCRRLEGFIVKTKNQTIVLMRRIVVIRCLFSLFNQTINFQLQFFIDLPVAVEQVLDREQVCLQINA